MEELHEHTYGITSDALTKFTVVFSALVHDVGHTGVPNNVAATESPELAERYENRCVAEQRSIETAWELLMLPQYENLRSCLFGNKASEAQRFRQVRKSGKFRIARLVLSSDRAIFLRMHSFWSSFCSRLTSSTHPSVPLGKNDGLRLSRTKGVVPVPSF